MVPWLIVTEVPRNVVHKHLRFWELCKLYPQIRMVGLQKFGTIHLTYVCIVDRSKYPYRNFIDNRVPFNRLLLQRVATDSITK